MSLPNNNQEELSEKKSKFIKKRYSRPWEVKLTEEEMKEESKRWYLLPPEDYNKVFDALLYKFTQVHQTGFR